MDEAFVDGFVCSTVTLLLNLSGGKVDEVFVDEFVSSTVTVLLNLSGVSSDMFSLKVGCREGLSVLPDSVTANDKSPV